MHNIYQFPVTSPRKNKKCEQSLLVGCGYPRETFSRFSPNYPDTLIANYEISTESALVRAASEQDELLYIYDADQLPHDLFKSNQLQLMNAFTDGPEIEEDELSSSLVMRLHFPLQFTTHASDAQLGVVHLVQSQRHLQLQNGEQIPLLETDEPVLYLDHNNHKQGIELISADQNYHSQMNYQYCLQLQQAIPERVKNIPLETLTVLEQYQTFFMQRPLLDDQESIWTPIMSPVSWGWSIRIGRRADNAWSIIRRKLMLPTVGHEGLELPQWQGNSRQSLA